MTEFWTPPPSNGMNPYASLGNRVSVTHSAGPDYGRPTPYGAGQNWAAQQLKGLGWQPGQPAPTVGDPSDPNAQTYVGPGGVQTPYDQSFVNSLYKSYTDTHNPEADARLAAYSKTMGTPGGIIPPTSGADQDPWGTLNSMGMNNPSTTIPVWMQPAPDPWAPTSYGEGVTSFGKWWGAGSLAPGNGPGGFNQSNIQSPGAGLTLGPWGAWDSSGVGVSGKPPKAGDPWYNSGSSWYG